MKIDDRTWEFVAKTLDLLKTMNAELDVVMKAVGLEYESPLIKSPNDFGMSMIAAMSELIGDRYNMLEWYALDCDYGDRPKKAGWTDENVRLISTTDDLRKLLEEE